MANIYFIARIYLVLSPHCENIRSLSGMMMHFVLVAEKVSSKNFEIQNDTISNKHFSKRVVSI